MEEMCAKKNTHTHKETKSGARQWKKCAQKKKTQRNKEWS
jgi:hypothetical protein